MLNKYSRIPRGDIGMFIAKKNMNVCLYQFVFGTQIKFKGASNEGYFKSKFYNSFSFIIC